MKKFLFSLVCCSALFATLTPAHAIEAPEDEWDVLDGVIMWLPNLAVNLVDIFTVEVGAGGSLSLGTQATRACRIGFTTDVKTAKLMWGPNRQFGGSLDDGYEFSIFCFTWEEYTRDLVTRNVKRYDRKAELIPLPTEVIYEWYDGPRNYWACSLWGSLFIQGQVDVNLDQVADCITSFFFFDIKGDWIRYYDMTGKSLK